MEIIDNSSFTSLFNYELYKDLSKSNRPYLLYDTISKSIISNLSTYDIFDIFKRDNLNSVVKLFDVEINEFIENNKYYYELFKDLFNAQVINIIGYDYKPVNERLLYDCGRIPKLNKYIIKNEYLNIKPNPKANFYHIKTIIYNICGEDINSYNYLIKLLAFKLQNPLIMAQAHIVIRDDGGTGKTELFLGDILSNIYNVNICTQNDLISPYNDFMVGYQFVAFEEVEGFEDEKRLKYLTGAKELFINEKYEKKFYSKNYANLIINSNELRTLKITQKDRRWSFIGGGKRLIPLPNQSWSKTYFKSKEKNKIFFDGYHKNLKKELKELYSYLLSVNVTRTDIQVGLSNSLRDNMIDVNKTSDLLFMDDIIEDGLYNLVCELYKKNFNIIFGNLLYKHDLDEKVLNGYWVKLSEFYEMYIVYCKNNNLNKPLSKKMFLKRLENYDKFNDYFGDYRVIKIDGITHRCLKLNNYRDDNLEDINISTIDLPN